MNDLVASGRVISSGVLCMNLFSILCTSYCRLHLKFTWLLKAGADRLVEKMVEGLPMPDLGLDLYSHQGTAFIT
jgi:hypothetical protein